MARPRYYQDDAIAAHPTGALHLWRITHNGEPVGYARGAGGGAEGGMSAHTPGPWSTGGIFHRKDGNRSNIWAPTPLGAQSGRIVAEQALLADARLIAAAPELLRALKLAMNVIDAEQQDHGLDWVRALIARAEGAD